MADNQPAQTPAPAPDASKAPAQEPEQKPAEQQPAAQPEKVTLTDDQKSYLKSQGIEEDKLTSPEAVLKLINHATTAQKTAAEARNQLDKIKNTVAPEPQQPTNPFQVEPVSQQPQDGQPNTGLDPVTAFTLSTSLAANFPEVKEDLVSGKLYQDMQKQGIPLTVNGQVNVNGITNYAAFRKQQIELDKKLEEAGKPPEGAIPPVDPGVPKQPDENAPMTKQMALAILAQDKSHPRAAEAAQFLQTPSKK